MVEEAWYQSISVDKEYVYNDSLLVIIKSPEWKNLRKISQRLPYLILDIGFLHPVIISSIEDWNIGSCSIRGYICNIRYGLIENIKDKIIAYTKVKALLVLSNSKILQNWVNHILYRPNGLRYTLLKKEFESLVH
jgi:hypothetical protein